MDPNLAACVCAVLLVSVGLLAERAGCQHYYLLRPIPSDTLPLVDLREDPDPALDPRERDLNETELLGLLGDFDSRFLALSPMPSGQDGFAGNDDPREDAELLQKSGGVVPKEIRALDLDVQLQGRRPIKPISKKLKRRLQQWLWAYSFCPVRYSWSDLGARFWPRYVRAGSCLAKRSCSLPEGMLCQPAASTHLTLLRWRCAHRKAGLKCAWIPVHYPVITDCKCACAT
ncbi:noggin-1 [Syngnathoides biaculeatus]|uniref:noggin-1 n=1 Tax=Syngnathoides biaculeatus TaxID=300417 RepID=UPI002ADDDC0C|nr:noggin-1 [Syngnathoides biaculeatus]